MNTNKLVVAVDFSSPSIQALETAVNLCQQLNSTLHIVYIADMDSNKVGKDDAEGEHSIEARVLKDFEHELEVLVLKMSTDKIDFTTEVEYGDPTKGIVRIAAKVNADMIVIGTHGRTGMEYILVGSVAESVLRKTTIPVICVRAGTSATA